MDRIVNLYLVASPLQYLAAKAIATYIEPEHRQILIWYKPGMGAVIVQESWDACSYMPWPRLEPLPGPFGSHKRLLQNIELVSGLIGSCDTLHIHSAVFDTEAINYFLRALPAACGARNMRARILPDGIISIRRYPLNLSKRILQCFRKLRLFSDRRLDYWCFSGDRIGSDAPFCDRVYVVPGLPHEYPLSKVVILPQLIEIAPVLEQQKGKRALVIGQPLVSAGLLNQVDLSSLTFQIRNWLLDGHFDQVDYKGHPKDSKREFCCDDYRVLELKEPLETWMAKIHYDAVVGVRSSALLFARQIYSADTRVIAFGWDKVKFKSAAERKDMLNAFTECGITLVDWVSCP
jgi:hypothetical protein